MLVGIILVKTNQSSKFSRIPTKKLGGNIFNGKICMVLLNTIAPPLAHEPTTRLQFSKSRVDLHDNAEPDTWLSKIYPCPKVALKLQAVGGQVCHLKHQAIL